MNSNEFDDYIKSVLSQIAFVFEHKNIKRELMSHLNDLYEEYVEQGLETSELIRRVIEDMGDPVKIGKELNQIHHPLIGWLWHLSRIAVIVLAVYSLFLVGAETLSHLLNNRFISDKSFDIEQFLHDKRSETNEVHFDLDMNILITLEDGKLLLDRLIQLEDGTVFVLYQEKHNLNLFDTKERFFDLRRYSQLHVDDAVFVAQSDGLIAYDHWQVLIFKNVSFEYSHLELKYKQVSETFEKVLR